MQEPFAQFKARYILLDFMLATFILAIPIAVISISRGITDEKLEANELILTLSCILMISLCFATIYRLKKCGVHIKQLFGETSLEKLPWLMLFTIFFGIRVLQTGTSQLTIFVINLISPDLAKTAIKTTSSNFSLNYDTDSVLLKVILYIFLVLALVVVAPVVEEFIFRGVLLHRFGAKWGVIPAIFVSSILFGLAHWNYHIIGLTTTGIAFALVYLKTKSLSASIVLHSMHNGIAFLFMIASALSVQTGPAEITYSTLIAGAVNTIFGFITLFYFFGWPSNSDLLPYEANSNN
jgi:uncharacterized protein